MISGFLTSTSAPPTTPAYRGTPYVIDFHHFYPAFLAMLISEPIESGTDVADKTRRYISEIAGQSGEVEKVTNER